MRLTNVVIVVTLLFLCFLVLDDVRTNDLKAIANAQSKLNNVLDNATADAMIHSIEIDSGRARIINKDDIVKQFFNSLYINLDIMEQPSLKNKINGFIPVMAIVDDDGFYIRYMNEMSVKGERLCVPTFTEKIMYSKIYGGYKVNYTLNDYVYITDLSTEEIVEGNYHDLQNCYPVSFFVNDSEYDEERRNVIISRLTETITEYINKHNYIAHHFGIQYHFILPKIEKEEWYRTIDNISLVVFFQGYPYGGGTRGYYNRVSIGGARVRKDT